MDEKPETQGMLNAAVGVELHRWPATPPGWTCSGCWRRRAAPATRARSTGSTMKSVTHEEVGADVLVAAQRLPDPGEVLLVVVDVLAVGDRVARSPPRRGRRSPRRCRRASWRCAACRWSSGSHAGASPLPAWVPPPSSPPHRRRGGSVRGRGHRGPGSNVRGTVVGSWRPSGGGSARVSDRSSRGSFSYVVEFVEVDRQGPPRVGRAGRWRRGCPSWPRPRRRAGASAAAGPARCGPGPRGRRGASPASRTTGPWNTRLVTVQGHRGVGAPSGRPPRGPARDEPSGSRPHREPADGAGGQRSAQRLTVAVPLDCAVTVAGHRLACPMNPATNTVAGSS